MTEPYLILHKVRGLAAFDIAIQLEAPDESNGADQGVKEIWWIIPTSGHRAYPWWTRPISEYNFYLDGDAPPMPEDIADHYAINNDDKPAASPSKPRLQPEDIL